MCLPALDLAAAELDEYLKICYEKPREKKEKKLVYGAQKTSGSGT